MKRTALFILTGCFAVLVSVQAQSTENTWGTTMRNSKVNVGVKTGFNSAMFFVDDLKVGDYSFDHIQNNYKVGYFASFFVRFNLRKHHFFQTEASYNIIKGSVSIAKTLENTDFLKDNALVKTTIHSIDIPLLYGYKFIDSYPYGMALFAGPKVSYIWNRHAKSEYVGFYQQDISESFHPLYYSGVIGLAVNVSNIFFDFRYEVGLHNMSDEVTFDRAKTEMPYSEQEIIIKRRRNILSFSLGVIF